MFYGFEICLEISNATAKRASKDRNGILHRRYIVKKKKGEQRDYGREKILSFFFSLSFFQRKRQKKILRRYRFEPSKTAATKGGNGS